jgi:hypothetical protein
MVDNAMENTAMMKYLKTRMRSWDNHILNGDFMHMRCCTHVLNLIMKSGMKEDKGSSILKIREAVKYVKSSPPRLVAFMKCAADENVSYKGAIVLDVETRWNSTYLMLNVAVKYKDAFDLFYIQDRSFQHEMLLKSADGLQEKDWDYVISVLPFLKLVLSCLYLDLSCLYLEKRLEIQSFQHFCLYLDLSCLYLMIREYQVYYCH